MSATSATQEASGVVAGAVVGVGDGAGGSVQPAMLSFDASGRAKPLGLYDPVNERDACGTGFVARIDGYATHAVVADAVQVIVNLEHRGAVGGDKTTGDGAGILTQLPDGLFRREWQARGVTLPARGEYGVAMVFLPESEFLAEKCARIVEKAAQHEGFSIIGWRDVPNDPTGLGAFALATLPRIRQLFVGRGSVVPESFERKLYVARCVATHEVGRAAAHLAEAGQGDDLSPFYICTMSSRLVVYKGMLVGSQLTTFYPDLTDSDYTSAFAVVHQRYSTNTMPQWRLAQPFRHIAHNGEINTLRGNVNQFVAREPALASALFGDDLSRIRPIIDETGSDSAIFDNVLELLVHGGRSLPRSMMMMIPEPWGPRFSMGEAKRAAYEYFSALIEPWDGPAAMMFTDGRYVGALLDRNGLRPARYAVTHDGYVVMASETGVLELPPWRVQKRGRLNPGRMFLIDLEQRRIVPDHEIKSKVARKRPYRVWLQQNRIDLKGLFQPFTPATEEPETLLWRQLAFGFTEEELRVTLQPMANNAQEAVGSMGNDSALAALSDRPQLLYSYFKQSFAQVTNPPIDPLREELVMSLTEWLGPERNLLDETPEHCRRVRLEHPILTRADMERLRNARHPHVRLAELDAAFDLTAGDDAGKALEAGLAAMFAAAEKAIADGANILIVSDKRIGANRAAIPGLLAISGLNQHLTRAGLRTRAGIVAEVGDAREVMHMALLLGYGANAVCPHVALATVVELFNEKRLDSVEDVEEAVDNYITAIKKGLLKTFSRIGISTLRSFHGTQLFEAVGISRVVCDRYFTGTSSRVSGATLSALAHEVALRHERAFPKRGKPDPLLDVGGVYHLRKGGERHLWTPESVSLLQQAVRNDDYEAFKRYSASIDDQSVERVTLRSLFRFVPGEAVSIDEVEPVEAITTRFVTAAMSFGSISIEAHETIAIAMNRLKGKSNSGEGGEDPARYRPLPNGDSKRSAIKQIASGRFGVTTEYLVNADELQIKIAQGAKPGEGGQLPGFKVTGEIARVRHTTPGVTLISPPPHHDIYSIEDLKQLIYDLRMANPHARVSVKLVAEVGVGTIAAGVAKAKADMVLISGHDGGTGASPLTSIMHTGAPWELGLAETQQTLVHNGLRDRIRVQVDGQLKTGRDLAIAALMGAEEFGFGTSVLVSLGCIMMRKCHLNTCPVGVATQDERLRKHFTGTPEHVERFLRFMAQELREHMAALGFRTIDEMVGRVGRLDVEPAVRHWKASGLDLRPLLLPVAPRDGSSIRATRKQEHDVEQSFDAQIFEAVRPAIETGQQVTLKLPVRNVHRAVGTWLSGEVTRRHGARGLREGTIRLQLKGSAGQSLGAFLAPGISITVEGDTNDYVGKGMSGGRLVVMPPLGTGYAPHENAIAGNTCLYGATGGEVYLAGTAGVRFGVRNSGATAVVEGIGEHGCEYMTGGTVVVLGPTGYNFAAGMSGGIAYVYDDSEMFDTRCNLDMVELETVWTAEDSTVLKRLVKNHFDLTRSPRAEMLLSDWDAHLPLFVKVIPTDYRKSLERMALEQAANTGAVAATEEVYNG